MITKSLFVNVTTINTALENFIRVSNRFPCLFRIHCMFFIQIIRVLYQKLIEKYRPSKNIFSQILKHLKTGKYILIWFVFIKWVAFL